MATRNGRQAVRNGGGGVPGWALFVAGLVVGLIVMALAYRSIPSLRRNGQQPQANANAVAQPGSSAGIAATPSASAAASASASQFDFYKVLPEKEVVIPNAQLSAMAKAEQQKAAAANNATAATPPTASAAKAAASPASNAAAPAATQPASGGYVLQVGAFPSAAQASALQAKIAFQGISAHVQAVTLDGKEWHRVRLGPFATAIQLQNVQQRLRAAGLPAGVALKEKP